ncbi:MAG: gamma-glutamyltransferase [Gammaproteobacteria bacterium]|nr:gamma-glutamyltransferase [Gammaproteobacteria bacterium]
MKGFTFTSFILFLYLPLSFAQNPPQTAIATSHPLATQAGIQIVKQGGNAFDAAIAIAAVLAVVEPYNSGLGGGGFWLLRLGKNGRNIFIDARENAPLAANNKMYVVNNTVQQDKSLTGALAAGIPGVPAGLAYLALNYGTLSLQKSLAPAIQLAEDGFELDENFIKQLQTHEKLLSQFSSTQEIFLAQNKLPTKGAILKQPDLAKILKLLAEKGHIGFYSGMVAEKLVKDVKKNGGIWELEDLKRYQVTVREPLKGEYDQIKLVSAPLPSAGGIGVLTALNILSEFELSDLSDADHKHLLIESLRQIYCDRAKFLGDPDFVKVDVEKLLSEDHAESLRSKIKINKAGLSKSLECGNLSKEKEHTTHYSILDQQGNSVSATLTLNQKFGSGLIASGTGVLLNDEMNDFSLEDDISNKDGLIGHTANMIAPGKKPLSSMTPTFFDTAEGMGILGTPGGSRIPSIMLIALLSANKDYLPHTWMLTPRFHHQYLPDIVEFEPQAFTSQLQHALQLRGHYLQPTKEPYGDMQAIFWNKKENKVYAESDPRGQGLAIVESIGGK